MTNVIEKRNPDSYNFLAANKFDFTIQRAPNLTFFVVNATLPSVNTNETQYQNPFKTIKVPGDNLETGSLDLTFRIDENMNNYSEIYEWMKGIGFPNSFTERNDLQISRYGLVSDCTLIINSSKHNTAIAVTFKDAFPTYLSSITFTSESTDLDYITSDVTFAFTGLEIKKITL